MAPADAEVAEAIEAWGKDDATWREEPWSRPGTAPAVTEESQAGRNPMKSQLQPLKSEKSR